MSDETVPPIFANDEEAYELLLRAVDLAAVAHNCLVWLPSQNDPKNGWEYFYRRAHRLREALNHPDHERLRVAYVRALAHAHPGSVPPGDTNLEIHDRLTLDETFSNAPTSASTPGDSDRARESGEVGR